MTPSKYMQLTEKEKGRYREYCRAYYRHHKRTLLKQAKERRSENLEGYRARNRISNWKYNKKIRLRKLMYSQLVYLAFGGERQKVAGRKWREKHQLIILMYAQIMRLVASDTPVLKGTR